MLIDLHYRPKYIIAYQATRSSYHHVAYTSPFLSDLEPSQAGAREGCGVCL